MWRVGHSEAMLLDEEVNSSTEMDASVREHLENTRRALTRRGTSIALSRAMPSPRKRSIAPQDLPDLDSATFRRILQCVQPYLLRACGVGACMVLAGPVNLFAPLVVD